ncbi:MAG TPA: hypothetical protein VK129_11965 [Terriglobales bacterium]|nr:hypothetical protein [Terriglobales bacterium]
MKNFTQKALFVVLTVFVLVGMFYGLSTPVQHSTGDVPKAILQDEPVPNCPLSDGSFCPGIAAGRK